MKVHKGDAKVNRKSMQCYLNNYNALTIKKYLYSKNLKCLKMTSFVGENVFQSHECNKPFKPTFKKLKLSNFSKKCLRKPKLY